MCARLAGQRSPPVPAYRGPRADFATPVLFAFPLWSPRLDRVSEQAEHPVGRPAGAAILAAAALDVVFVALFAASGRSQHGEAATLAGLWQTAWPFLAALALVWAAALVWRRPMAVLRSGLPVWLGTVALGMVLRVAFTDGGAALPFVLVATGVLGASLVGWRLVAALLRRLRRRSS